MIVEIELAVIIVLLAYGPVTEALSDLAERKRRAKYEADLAAEHEENQRLRAAIARENHHEQT